MNRLVRLRTEVGHPEKPGEPLPQDQAAARAGVTTRQWQRWESGASVPYARNLSAVADAFIFDVAEFYDGPAGQRAAATPDPFPVATIEGVLADVLEKIMAQLTDQTRVLDEIKSYAAAAKTMLEEQKALKIATDEQFRRLTLAIADRTPEASPPDSPQAPPKTAAAKTKRAAASRTP